MKAMKTLAAIAMCIFSISFSHAASVSVANPSFEEGWSGWEDSDPSAISGEGYQGDKSAKLEGAGAKAEQLVSVSPNTDYVLTAWLKGTGKIGAIVGAEEVSAVLDASGWEMISVTFNSGANDTITIFAADNGGQGRFDAFSLQSK